MHSVMNLFLFSRLAVWHAIINCLEVRISEYCVLDKRELVMC